MGKLDPIIVRAPTPEDMAFIYATWLRGLYYGSEWYREIPRFIYFKKYCEILKALLAKPTLLIQVACLKEDTDVLVAFSVTEKLGTDHFILHWIYTKSAWRQLGIAKMLLPNHSLIQEVTHLTKVGRSIKPNKWIFNPFLI